MFLEKRINNDALKELYANKRLRKIDNIYFLWNYDKVFKELLFKYKFNGNKKIGTIFARMINKELRQVIEKENIDIIITIPISKKRYNERGFNQVNIILDNINIDYIEVKRIKNTIKMYKLLTESERINNIENSFIFPRNIDMNNKKILIVDDVVTTGTTIKEISRSIENKYVNTKIVSFAMAMTSSYKKI